MKIWIKEKQGSEDADKYTRETVKTEMRRSDIEQARNENEGC